MLKEDWVEAIKNALSPSAFRDVGVAALRVLYQFPVRLADGAGDGGVDAWLALPSGEVPVQFYAGRAEPWEAKLERDLGSHERLRASKRMFFIYAGAPMDERQGVALRRKKLAPLEARFEVEITMLDARDIAGTADDPEVRALLCRVLGIPIAEGSRARLSAADVARLAFAFFHDNSGDFRAEVARSVIAACLYAAQAPVEVKALVDQAVTVAGPGLEWALGRVVEAMRGEGLLVVADGKAAASAELAEMTAAAIALQQGAAERLREVCMVALEKRVHAADRRRALVDDIFPDLGLLVREGLADMLPGRSADAVARRLNALELRVAAHLKPSGGDAGEAVRALVEVVAASPYGRALGTAELFMHMSERESTHLATALTARPVLEIWLDASVALPMLCGKHDRVVRRWPTSEIAVELHAALVSRRVKLVVPSPYVEEMAAHLIDAARRYRPLVGADPALARSENYFVAHYHAVAQDRQEPATVEEFDRFLRGFGLPLQWEALEQRDYYRLRRLIERHVQSLFETYYDVTYARVGAADAVELPGEPQRSEIVLRHDRCVARELDELVQRQEGPGRVLCTEDRWFVDILTDMAVPALHPAVLLDAIQIIRPDGEARRLAAVQELAATFDDRALTEGAAVWDMLAELRDPELSNRALLDRAREFKEAWLAQARGEERPHAEEWMRFKATHGFGR